MRISDWSSDVCSSDLCVYSLVSLAAMPADLEIALALETAPDLFDDGTAALHQFGLVADQQMAVAKLPLTIGHHVPNREPVRVEKALERIELACAAPDEELADRERAKDGLCARLEGAEVLPPEGAR